MKKIIAIITGLSLLIVSYIGLIGYTVYSPFKTFVDDTLNINQEITYSEAEYNALLNSKNEEISSLENIISVKDNEIIIAQNSIELLQLEIANIRSLSADEIAVKNAEIDVLNTQILSLTSERDSLLVEVANLTADRDELQSAVLMYEDFTPELTYSDGMVNVTNFEGLATVNSAMFMIKNENGDEVLFSLGFAESYSVSEVGCGVVYTATLVISDGEYSGVAHIDFINEEPVSTVVNSQELATMTDGDLVTITGVVQGSYANNTLYLADDFGSYASYVGDDVSMYNVGDKVSITGAKDVYYGSLQVGSVSNIEFVSSGNAVLNTVDLTGNYEVDFATMQSQKIIIDVVYIDSSSYLNNVTFGSQSLNVLLTDRSDIADNFVAGSTYQVIGFVAGERIVMQSITDLTLLS